MQRLKVGTASSAKPGLATGVLRTGDLPDGEPITIPVMIMRGERDGPVLWMHGCVHGDELCGAYIIHELMRSLDAKTLKGIVVALPILNLTGSERMQRMSPYEMMAHGDLNRCFPGRAGGALTEQMGFHIYRELKRHADYFIDFHTALTPDTRWALYANAPGEAGKKAGAMARAFGFKSTLPAPMDILGGSAMMAAAKDGIPSLIVEAGGIGPAFDMETVKDCAERLRNVLRQLKMLPGKVVDHGPQYNFSNFAWINATRGGLFQPSVACGQKLRKGQSVGTFYNVWGEAEADAKAPESGIVLAIAPGPILSTGDVLVHIGLNPQAI